MTAKNRTTLNNYFKSGSLPSEDQFKDLIDSMLNMRDEGFDKTAQDGFKVIQLPDGKLISFSDILSGENPIWFLKMESGYRNLSFLSKNAKDLSEDEKEILTLTPDGKVGIKQNKPDFELDVAGTIASRGRIGEKGTVPANGGWHNITGDLEGCNAFEIMAGVGKPKSGKYALLHAFALKTFNSRGKIVYHQAHFGSRCNRLKLRWKKGPDKTYTLELKTRCRYGIGDQQDKSQKNGDKSAKDGSVYVKYYITNLWFDNLMEDCINP